MGLGARLFVTLQYLLPQHAITALVYRLARARAPWLKNALVLGFMRLYAIELDEAAEPDPARYAANYAFRTKMVALCVAVTFQFLIYRKVIRSGTAESHSTRNIVVACCSLVLWFLVGWAGRAIAFLG